eukprot:comp24048_c0_seq1/m.43151 comp24048_c0_seq1/g.43151  ORF comp24048_c0_seq1/g.43151 comp24048_c0_seq1/m.43151 type:complete len:1138 (-) comp24048_c0_seq1:478-3891(-)
MRTLTGTPSLGLPHQLFSPGNSPKTLAQSPPKRTEFQAWETPSSPSSLRSLPCQDIPQLDNGDKTNQSYCSNLPHETASSSVGGQSKNVFCECDNGVETSDAVLTEGEGSYFEENSFQENREFSFEEQGFVNVSGEDGDENENISEDDGIIEDLVFGTPQIETDAATTDSTHNGDLAGCVVRAGTVEFLMWRMVGGVCNEEIRKKHVHAFFMTFRAFTHSGNVADIFTEIWKSAGSNNPWSDNRKSYGLLVERSCFCKSECETPMVCHVACCPPANGQSEGEQRLLRQRVLHALITWTDPESRLDPSLVEDTECTDRLRELFSFWRESHEGLPFQEEFAILCGHVDRWENMGGGVDRSVECIGQAVQGGTNEKLSESWGVNVYNMPKRTVAMTVKITEGTTAAKLRDVVCGRLGLPSEDYCLRYQATAARLDEEVLLQRAGVHDVLLCPKAVSRVEIVNPILLARLLTSMDHTTFSTITWPELHHQAWSRDPSSSPMIGRLTRRFNAASAWAVWLVLGGDGDVKRAMGVEVIIQVAQACYELSNLHGAISMVSALKYHSVRRLKKSWELVAPAHIDTLDRLETLLTPGNRAAYRLALNKRQPPCLPYVGFYLSDVVLADEAAPDWIHHGGHTLVNFMKYLAMANIFDEMRRFMLVPFEPQDTLALDRYLMSLPPLNEEEAYQRSLELEPALPRPPRKASSSYGERMWRSPLKWGDNIKRMSASAETLGITFTEDVPVPPSQPQSNHPRSVPVKRRTRGMSIPINDVSKMLISEPSSPATDGKSRNRNRTSSDSSTGSFRSINPKIFSSQQPGPNAPPVRRKTVADVPVRNQRPSSNSDPTRRRSLEFFLQFSLPRFGSGSGSGSGSQTAQTSGSNSSSSISGNTGASSSEISNPVGPCKNSASAPVLTSSRNFDSSSESLGSNTLLPRRAMSLESSFGGSPIESRSRDSLTRRSSIDSDPMISPVEEESDSDLKNTENHNAENGVSLPGTGTTRARSKSSEPVIFFSSSSSSLLSSSSQDGNQISEINPENPNLVLSKPPVRMRRTRSVNSSSARNFLPPSPLSVSASNGMAQLGQSPLTPVTPGQSTGCEDGWVETQGTRYRSHSFRRRFSRRESEGNSSLNERPVEPTAAKGDGE